MTDQPERPAPRSAIWVALDTGGVAVLSLLAMLVIARFAGPADFGVAALCIGIVQVANLYAEGLLHDALVQNRDTGEDHFRQAFWLGGLAGSALFLAAFAGWVVLRGTTEGVIAGYFAAAALSLPFSALLGVGNARLRRRFAFREVAIPSVVGKLASIAIGVAIAVAGGGAWALVVQFLFAAVANLAIQTAMTRWVPPPTRHAGLLRPLWRFALPNAFMHTLVGGRIQLFTLLVASLMGLSAAGYINVAFRLTLTPQVLLTTAITNFGLPMLARHQDSRAHLRDAFLWLGRIVAAAGVPLFLGVAVVAEPLVATMLGPEWQPSVLPMRLFALTAAIAMIRVSGSLLLRAIGLMRYSLFNAIAHLAVTIGALLAVRPHDPVTAALFWLLPAVPLIPATLAVVRRETGFGVATQLQSWWPAAMSGAAMAAAGEAIIRAAADQGPAIQLVAAVAGAGATYLVVLLALDPVVRGYAVRPLRRSPTMTAGDPE